MEKEKKKKEKLTITLSSDILSYIEKNFTKKSRFIEYCIEEELKKYRKSENE
jgi:hypothetical protein